MRMLHVVRFEFVYTKGLLVYCVILEGRLIGPGVEAARKEITEHIQVWLAPEHSTRRRHVFTERGARVLMDLSGLTEITPDGWRALTGIWLDILAPGSELAVIPPREFSRPVHATGRLLDFGVAASRDKALRAFTRGRVAYLEAGARRVIDVSEWPNLEEIEDHSSQLPLSVQDESAEDLIASQIRLALRLQADKSKQPGTATQESFIYLSDGTASSGVESAIAALAQAFGWELTPVGAPIRGSWFRRFRLKTTNVLKSPEAKDIAEHVRRAAELRALNSVQAENDGAQAQAAATLIQALEGTDQAVMLVGSLLIIKDKGQLAVRTLTQRQLIHLERSADMTEPHRVLEALEKCSNELTSGHSADKQQRQRELPPAVG